VRSNQPTEKKADKTISSQRSRIKYPSNENLSQPRETSFPKPQSRDKLGVSRSLKDSAIHGGSVGALDNHSNQQALSLTPSRHLDSSGAGDLSRRFHTLQNPSQSSAGNPSGKNFSGNTQVTVTEQYGATPSHFSVHTEGKTSRSSGGDRERERIRLDSSSMTGSIGTEQELSHQLQSGIQSKMLEELQALRCDLQLLDESSRRLEAQLKELQRNTKTDSEYSAQHIDSIARKVDKLEARTDEFKLFTDSKLQAHATNFKNLEGRFEYWMGNALRNLHDSIEGVENQVKQLENRVGNLAQRPSSSWWNHSDSSLQNHFITSLLHLLAFLAIVVSYILQLFLKSINYATHMLQHRSGLSVMIMLLFVLLVCYKWIPFFEDTIDTQLSYMWQWIQRYLRKS
jgi:conjugal transfer/entry exclusion protein